MLLSICNFLQPGQYGEGRPVLGRLRVLLLLLRPDRRQQLAHRHRRRLPRQRALHRRAAQHRRRRRRTRGGRPGHWNDPDYLAPDQGMTAAQFRTQFSMWAMLAAPLMISDDLTKIAARASRLLQNREVIAIDQDPGRRAGHAAVNCPATARCGSSRCRRLARRRAAQPRLERHEDPNERERHRAIVRLLLRVARPLDARYELDQRLDRRRGAARQHRAAACLGTLGASRRRRRLRCSDGPSSTPCAQAAQRPRRSRALGQCSHHAYPAIHDAAS